MAKGLSWSCSSCALKLFKTDTSVKNRGALTVVRFFSLAARQQHKSIYSKIDSKNKSHYFWPPAQLAIPSYNTAAPSTVDQSRSDHQSEYICRSPSSHILCAFNPSQGGSFNKNHHSFSHAISIRQSSQQAPKSIYLLHHHSHNPLLLSSNTAVLSSDLEVKTLSRSFHSITGFKQLGSTNGNIDIENSMSAQTQQEATQTADTTAFSMDSLQDGIDSAKHHETNGTSQRQATLKPKDIKIPVPFGHIAAQVWGNPNAKTKILALHGWLDNSGTFDNLIPLLIETEDYYIVAYDDVGTGHSSHLPDGILYDRALLLTTMRRVIKHLGWREYVLMGHSLGALNSMSYASIYPSEVTRIISIDIIMPPVFKQETWQGKARGFIEDGINHVVDTTTYSYDDALKRVVEGHMKSLSVDNAKTLMKRGTRKVVIHGEETKYIFNRDVRIRSLFMEFLSDKQYLEIYKNMRCHLLILRSTIVDHSNMGDIGSFYKCFKEVNASFKEELISGTHHIHLGNPTDCAESIKKWMQQCDAIDEQLASKKSQ